MSFTREPWNNKISFAWQEHIGNDVVKELGKFISPIKPGIVMATRHYKIWKQVSQNKWADLDHRQIEFSQSKHF